MEMQVILSPTSTWWGTQAGDCAHSTMVSIELSQDSARKWAELLMWLSWRDTGRLSRFIPNWKRVGSVSSLQVSQAEQARFSCEKVALEDLLFMLTTPDKTMQQETQSSWTATLSSWKGVNRITLHYDIWYDDNSNVFLINLCGISNVQHYFHFNVITLSNKCQIVIFTALWG